MGLSDSLRTGVPSVPAYKAPWKHSPRNARRRRRTQILYNIALKYQISTAVRAILARRIPTVGLYNRYMYRSRLFGLY